MLQNHAECHHEQCTNSVQCFVRDLTCFICETLKQGYSQKKNRKVLFHFSSHHCFRVIRDYARLYFLTTFLLVRCSEKVTKVL